ncbi:MAG: hypothetical protein Q8Q01_01525 [archaeon]|nr:hypothetical protein [archaeon]
MEKRALQVVGLWMIFLFVTLPVYSASVMAVPLVSITKNSGEANIDKFIDADGDTWKVNALITSATEENIDPKNVVMKVGSKESPFNACASTPQGVSCEYISPLTDGVREDAYLFEVVYHYLNEVLNPATVKNADVIRADGTAPTVEITKLKQNLLGEVELDFLVKDTRGDIPSVGISKIEIIDADTNQILQTIGGSRLEVGQKEFKYSNIAEFGGKLQAELAGEGVKRIKITAEDRLGHITEHPAIGSFRSDFIDPVILGGTLNFTDLGKFIGEFSIKTDITLDVKENNLASVTASSIQVDLDRTPANCYEDDKELGLYHCTWENVEIQPSTSLELTVTVTDRFGNSVEQRIGRSDFVVDTSPPVIEFMGTEQIFDDKSFIMKGENRIILLVRDQGAGITENGIRARLSAFGMGAAEAPDECSETEDGKLFCYWDVSFAGSTDVAITGLSVFEDNVGNKGSSPDVQLFSDASAPVIEKVELFGVSDLIGVKDFFQSNDRLRIDFTIRETNGLNILVNTKDIVLDSELSFPEGSASRGLGDGWQVFNEESCVRSEARWVCSIETTPMKSGPDPSADVEILVHDTAGNEAKAIDWEGESKNVVSGRDGKFKINLLGLVTEENPDYWELQRAPRPLIDFIDLDTTELTYTRMPVELKFGAGHPQAQMLRADLVGCSPVDQGNESSSGPEVSRTILYGGNYPDGEIEPTATMILEFSPFNGREMFATEGGFAEAVVSYSCQLRVFSKVGKDAIASPELQEVQVEVPFGFSTIGALDENLAKKVRALKNEDWFEFLDALSYINTALEWARYIGNILSIIDKTSRFIDLVSGNLVGVATVVEKTGGGAVGVGTALRGQCLTLEVGQKTAFEFVEYIQIPIDILSCSPDPGNLGAYGQFQDNILETYNLLSGRGLLGIPATSLYENLYTSGLGLCVPGLLYQAEKARQVMCRKIVCYGREVPSGLTTFEGCDALYDIQMCEFVYGPLFDFTPLGSISYIGKAIKAAFTSLVGVIKWIEMAACADLCFDPAGTSAAIPLCKITTGLNILVDITDTVIGAIEQTPDATKLPYCDMAENIDLNELTGG